MTKLVKQTAGLWEGEDGARECVIYHGDSSDVDERWRSLDVLKRPLKKVCTFLINQDGERVVLPFTELAWLLPDRTGVIVIFKAGSYVNAQGSDIFPAPNNAAIYNADGSLRFQLILDGGDRIEAIHSGSMPSKFKDKMGVVIATHPEAPPEWVYAVDPENPALIQTGQWVRW